MSRSWGKLSTLEMGVRSQTEVLGVRLEIRGQRPLPLCHQGPFYHVKYRACSSHDIAENLLFCGKLQ